MFLRSVAVAGYLVFLWMTIHLSSASQPIILTKHIYTNLTYAKTAAYVDPALFLNVTSYSGYLNVDDKYDANIFFWYFPVVNKPLNETPWIIWLQGGPGGSSLIGLFDEVGPFLVDGNLQLREESWWKDYSMVFIDNPVGAGFSYTTNENGYPTDMKTYSQHLFVVLEQLMMLFPELSKAPLYIAGESYAGRYIPAFASAIIEGRNFIGNLNANLKGIIMGNPVMEREDVANLTEQFYRWGILDPQGVKAVKPLQEIYSDAVKDGNSELAFKAHNKLIGKLEEMTAVGNLYNVLDRHYLKQFVEFLEIPEIRTAIHVGETEFHFNNKKVHEYLIPDFLSSVTTKMDTILENCDVLIYCGELDLVTPCLRNAETRRQKWRWSMRDMFLKAPRTPWSYNENIVGYHKKGGRLTEVSITGAGHLVPLEKPAEMHQLISYFIRGLDLPTPSDYVVNPNDTAPYDEETTTTTKAPNITAIQTTKSHIDMNPGLIASVSINIVLTIIVMIGLIYYIRRKMRANYFYSTVDNISDEMFLS